MKVTVQYGKNAYGNDHDNDNFDVILHKCFCH